MLNPIPTANLATRVSIAIARLATERTEDAEDALSLLLVEVNELRDTVSCELGAAKQAAWESSGIGTVMLRRWRSTGLRRELELLPARLLRVTPTQAVVSRGPDYVARYSRRSGERVPRSSNHNAHSLDLASLADALAAKEPARA